MLGDGKVGSLSSSAPHLPLGAFVFLSVKQGTGTRGGGRLDSLSSGFPGTWGLVIFRVANGGWPPRLVTYVQPPTWPRPSLPGPSAVGLRAVWLASDVTAGETVTSCGGYLAPGSSGPAPGLLPTRSLRGLLCCSAHFPAKPDPPCGPDPHLSASWVCLS